MTRLHVSMSFSARLSLVHLVAWNPTSTEFQPQLLTDLSRLSNRCSLYVWCLVCPRSHSALPLCLHFHRPFAHIRSSFCRTFFMDSSSLLCLPSPLLCFSLFFRSASYPSSSSPSLLLLPLSSPSNLISLRPFLLLLLCPPPLYPISPFSCLPSLDTILVQAGPPHFRLVSLP